MVTTILTAASFAVADIDDKGIPQKKLPTEEMYQREGMTERSLAAEARDDIQAKSLLLNEEESENITVGTRAMPHSDYVSHQEERAIAQRDETEELASLDEESSLEIVKKGLESKDLVPKKVYYTSHEGAYHRPIAVTIFGEQVTLEDGSIWTVSSWDQWKTLDWYTTDTILVMQNKWLFSSYKFMLVNQNTGKEVECNLTLGPIYSGAYTHWIVAIDYYNFEVILEDGSIWQIDPFDYSVMKKWLVNDTIIVGVNEASCVYHPNILINVNMVNYSCGICLN